MKKLFFILAVTTAVVPLTQAQRTATPPDKIALLEGFEAELLYTVPRDIQGSWVAMCQDDKGRLIVSDQYGSSIFTLDDGTQVIGRIMNMSGDHYRVNTNMMNPSSAAKVDANAITSIEPSPVSMMPPGLINMMERDDILDLLAYLISGGDSDHELFAN